MSTNRLVNKKEAARLLSSLGDSFMQVFNPSYVHPGYELYPLSPPTPTPVAALKGAVMDMDGTTTTTEELCIFSLEMMVRKVTNRLHRHDWHGLDHLLDYPFIIGNSTTKHVEYLITKYGEAADRKALHTSFFYAALWTVAYGQDLQRKKEVLENIKAFGYGDAQKFTRRAAAAAASKDPDRRMQAEAEKLARSVHYKGIEGFSNTVRAAIDIYYQVYHYILLKINTKQYAAIKRELGFDGKKKLIEPMKGIALYLALVKGLLGKDAGLLAEHLISEYDAKYSSGASDLKRQDVARTLRQLGERYERQPLAIAVVTSSIFYEADIVLREVFREISAQIKKWPVPAERKKRLLKAFSGYEYFYDAVITATDSSEIRLKPHRDLYSIALYKLGIAREDFANVAGFEDSESGTIAIRAAGIGICAAVPFAQTMGHTFKAATHVFYGGLPELISRYHTFLHHEQ